MDFSTEKRGENIALFAFLAFLSAIAMTALCVSAVLFIFLEKNQEQTRGLRDSFDTLQKKISSSSGNDSGILNEYRNSVCLIRTSYVIKKNGVVVLRESSGASGFVAHVGLIATNRHVIEPWFSEPKAEKLISEGGHPELEEMFAFFPNIPYSVKTYGAVASSEDDVAVVRFNPAGMNLRPLPLSGAPLAEGEGITVVGFPSGATTLLAKAPPAIYQKFALHDNDLDTVKELAALSLIRPSPTYGHLGDVVGDRMIYDATTARGASGSPVFVKGEVVAINAAYVGGFPGGVIGISVRVLQRLIAVVEKDRIIVEPMPSK